MHSFKFLDIIESEGVSFCWCSIDKGQRCVDIQSEVTWCIWNPKLPKEVVFIFNCVLMFWWRFVFPIGSLAPPSEDMSVVFFCPEHAFFFGQVDSLIICGCQNWCMFPFLWMAQNVLFGQRFVFLKVFNGQICSIGKFFEKCIVDWIIFASLHFCEMNPCETSKEVASKSTQGVERRW